ncbi:MAG: hypothetical protein ACREUE_04150 [Panacagrimonas sp.]
METPMTRLLLTILLAAYTAIASSAGHEFDLPEAMTAAGEQVPPQVETYSFFYIKTSQTLKQDTQDLVGRLGEAAAENDYVGLAGPNPAWTRSVLDAAIAAHPGQSLKGLTLIYLGPSTDAPAVRALVERSGATLRYVVHPKSGA